MVLPTLGAGQKRPCTIYRLLVAGSLDETIIERQAGKEALLEMLQSKRLPDAKLEDRELLFTLDDRSVPSRLATHLDNQPELVYHTWTQLDLTNRAGVDSLGFHQPMSALAKATLAQPDVGAERLRWRLQGEIAQDAATDCSVPEYILSYVFHQCVRSDSDQLMEE